MKLTILCSNVANFRGSVTMDFWRYWNHHLSLHPPDNKEHLDEMVSLVKAHNADLVGLCEIDRCAHWSGSVNQPKYLAEKLSYTPVYAQNYFSILPFVYHADTGNAVLSKLPVIKCLSGKREFKRRHFYEVLTVPFGAKEFLHSVHRLPNNSILHVVCTHLSTNSRALRENNARDLVDYFRKEIRPFYEQCGHSYILMGDLNTVPLFTQQKHGFNDDNDFLIERIVKSKDVSKEVNNIINEFGILKGFKAYIASRLYSEDYRRERTLAILRDSNYFKSTMALDPFNPSLPDISPELYGTYPQKPNRMIDYIFVSPNLRTTDITPISVGFSDHKVIKTIVEIPDK